MSELDCIIRENDLDALERYAHSISWSIDEGEWLSAQREILRLRTALRPFATAAQVDENYQGAVYAVVGGTRAIITYDDLRRAREVLEEET